MLLFKCNSGDGPKSSFRIDTSRKPLRYGDTLQAQIKIRKEASYSQIEWFWDMESVELPLTIKKQPLGNHKLKAIVEHQDGVDTLQHNIILVADAAPKLFNYKIINTYSHDREAYTQGLEFNGDTLFESTGMNGRSSLRKGTIYDGTQYIVKPLDDQYFGEGLTLMNDKVYQLTWKAKKGFVYDQHHLTFQKAFDYKESFEGWGLCNDGKYLYKSDGSNRIWKLDPKTGAELSHIEVMTHRSALSKLNELEWVDGKIYANTYQFEKEVGLIIDPQTGKVDAVIDFSGLKNKVEQHPELNVLNGIAYHPLRKTFFVTGKNWDKLFEIELIEKK